MYSLYAAKQDAEPRLVATFGSEQQLLAYVRWATLESHAPQTGKFEQGSVLAGADHYEYSAKPPSREAMAQADPPHNPSPTML